MVKKVDRVYTVHSSSSSGGNPDNLISDNAKIIVQTFSPETRFSSQ